MIYISHNEADSLLNLVGQLPFIHNLKYGMGDSSKSDYITSMRDINGETVDISSKGYGQIRAEDCIRIEGLRYPIRITKTHITCHDRTETIEFWSSIDVEKDIKSPNAQKFWIEYGECLLNLARKYYETT